MNRTLRDKVEHYFETHKDSKECFVTVDEFIFHKVTDAEAYARTLSINEVLPITREQWSLGMFDMEDTRPNANDLAAENEDLTEEVEELDKVKEPVVTIGAAVKTGSYQHQETEASAQEVAKAEEPAKVEVVAEVKEEAAPDKKTEAPKGEKKSKGTNSKNG